ncbi:hypothetical protein AV530_014257 [Patagioenas fasciata monilis]|uniref:Uncharacterized protein n=2 Tax=Patagioenas fasciata TaxID=372321 RepID=A0A1V4JTI2_PATFA|nr:hypothetical protein AV530_014257 [Patagioenas fasciata monilis]
MLKGNNAKLTAALLESTANVKQWKQQLAAYQEEAEHLHKRTMEMMLDKKQSRAIFLFGFKMGHKVAETTRNVSNAFGPGTANTAVVVQEVSQRR